MKLFKSVRRHTRREESGVETVAMIIVIPFLVVLIFALIDVGRMFQTRMSVDNIARDTVRRVAADGGDMNPHTNTLHKSWTVQAQGQLTTASGKCKLSLCQPGKKPIIDCRYVTRPGGTPPTPSSYTGYERSETVPAAGWTVSCVVIYPYRGINQTLLNAPVLGMGMGTLIKPFVIVESARSETGCSGAGC